MVCTFGRKGSEMVTIQAHVIVRLHGGYSIECSGVIICAWIGTISEPLQLKVVEDFQRLYVANVPQPTQNSIKKTG